MDFTADTVLGLNAAAALIASAPDGSDPVDTLPTVATLADFHRDWGYTGRPVRTPEELAAVRELRPRLRELWEADELVAVDLVNEMLAEAGALPRLVRHDDSGWHIHAIDDDAPFDRRVLVETAMAVLDVIRFGELERLRICEATDCVVPFLDLSRNRSRRFCSTTCGNRMAAAAYRARQAAG